MIPSLLHLWAAIASICSSTDREVDAIVQQTQLIPSLSSRDRFEVILDVKGATCLHLVPLVEPDKMQLRVMRMHPNEIDRFQCPSDDVLMAAVDRLASDNTLKLRELIVEDDTRLPFDSANPGSCRFPSLLLLTLFSSTPQPLSYYTRFGFTWAKPSTSNQIWSAAQAMHRSPLRELLNSRYLEELSRKFPDLKEEDVIKPLPVLLRELREHDAKQAEKLLATIDEYGRSMVDDPGRINVFLILSRIYPMKKVYNQPAAL